MLTAIEKVDRPEHFKGNLHASYIRCLCECGNEKIARLSLLVNGTTTHCGCQSFNNIAGKKYGMLTAIKRVPKPDNIKNEGSYWECECECGNHIIVPYANLSSGNTQSCGCTRKEICRNNFKKYNTYDLSGEIGIGYDSHGRSFMFDLEDYDKIKDICWTVHHEYKVRKDGSHTNGKYYVTGKLLGTPNRTIRLHRYLMDVLDNPNILVDHKNGNGCDNTRSNLRYCNTFENSWNTKPKGNTYSKFKGVTYDIENNKWRAGITYYKKKYDLGRYDSEYDAALAYNEKAKELYGEFACLNNINSEVIING